MSLPSEAPAASPASRGRLPFVAAAVAIAAAAALFVLPALTTPHPAVIGVLMLGALAAIGGAIGVAGTRTIRGVAARPDRGGGLLGVAVFVPLALFLHGALSFAERQPRVVVGRAASPVSGAETIRIIDLNVWHDYPTFEQVEERRDAVVDALEALAPQIVVLQESWETTAHGSFAASVAEALGMDHAYAVANGSRARIGFEEGEAVLSAFPIRSARRVLLRPLERIYRNRVALVVELDTGGGETLTVVAVHLDRHRAPEQLRHLEEEHPFRTDGRLLLAGDFNSLPDSEAILGLTARGFLDPVPDRRDHVLVPGGADAAFDVARADYTLRPEDLDALVPERTVPRVSNHAGLLIDLARRP